MTPPAPSTTSDPAGDGVATDTPADAAPTPTSSPSATLDTSSSAVPAKPTPSSNEPHSGPYKLLRTYEGERFFDGWDFWKDADPTHGTVDYVDQAAAKAAGLISASAKSAVMRVDNTTRLAPGANRKSVRIHSKEPIKLGSLVIADILRMPFGCATWPAYWTHGPNWPNGGEIDIIEGVHNDKINQLTLHVKDSGCKLSSNPDITGKTVPANVDCNANNNGNVGCSYAETAAASYGKAFNDAGGGVIALLFSKDAISIWFWSHASKTMPQNIEQGSPDMATWGKPSATWPRSSCDIPTYFADQTIIFNTALCGDWAGNAQVWATACKDTAPTCGGAVADPANFDEAVWEIAYVKVYSLS
ncbi:hypothetical protein JCM8115_004843 [Rhodotorula mucilaginosa]